MKKWIIEFIKRCEGFSAEPYQCAAGYWTIGYGHRIRSVVKPSSISRKEGEDLLWQDVKEVERSLNRLVRVPLQEGQYGALLSFSFNVGSGALQRSTLRAKVNREEHAEIPAELMKWVYGGGRILPGLVRRRFFEGRMYSSSL